MKNGNRVLLCGLIAVLVGGCASVKVRKVPTPTQYTHWTDDMQKQADDMEGFRFYLPRPFANVFESFPIKSEVYMADGIVSADGKYVVVNQERSNSPLANYFAGAGTTVTIPAGMVGSPTTPLNSPAPITPHSVTVSEATNPAATIVATGVAGSASPSNSTPAPPKPPTPTGSSTNKTSPTTGSNSRTVTNDNSAYAVQPLRGSFDVVYLPDFEEQYVVSSHSGLGNAKFGLNLGQGWSLQGFNSLSDNSELNKRIFDLIDSASQLAKSAAMASLGIPPTAALTAGGSSLITPHSATVAEANIPGQPVTLKISVVYYAAKGLYPVLKGREFQQRIATTAERRLWFGLQGVFNPTPIWSSDFDQSALMNAQKDYADDTSKFTVPRYPYQFLSFNTFRYIGIEVVNPTAKVWGTLYPDIGTATISTNNTPPPTASGSDASGQTPTNQPQPSPPSLQADLDKLAPVVESNLTNFIHTNAAMSGYQIKSKSVILTQDQSNTNLIDMSISLTAGTGADDKLKAQATIALTNSLKGSVNLLPYHFNAGMISISNAAVAPVGMPGPLPPPNADLTWLTEQTPAILNNLQDAVKADSSLKDTVHAIALTVSGTTISATVMLAAPADNAPVIQAHTQKVIQNAVASGPNTSLTISLTNITLLPAK